MATHAPITDALTRASRFPATAESNKDIWPRPAPRVPAGPTSLAAKACVVLDFARPVSPSALLADMMDTLATCVTEPQLRAWLSATVEFRSHLPEMILQRVERARERAESEIARRQREDEIAERVRAYRLASDGHRTALMADIKAAMEKHTMPASLFGRLAVNDPALVRDLAGGRTLLPKTQARVRAFIASLDREGC
jgi:hypothetical protein